MSEHFAFSSFLLQKQISRNVVVSAFIIPVLLLYQYYFYMEKGDRVSIIHSYIIHTQSYFQNVLSEWSYFFRTPKRLYVLFLQKMAICTKSDSHSFDVHVYSFIRFSLLNFSNRPTNENLPKVWMLNFFFSKLTYEADTITTTYFVKIEYVHLVIM